MRGGLGFEQAAAGARFCWLPGTARGDGGTAARCVVLGERADGTPAGRLLPGDLPVLHAYYAQLAQAKADRSYGRR